MKCYMPRKKGHTETDEISISANISPCPNVPYDGAEFMYFAGDESGYFPPIERAPMGSLFRRMIVSITVSNMKDDIIILPKNGHHITARHGHCREPYCGYAWTEINGTYCDIPGLVRDPLLTRQAVFVYIFKESGFGTKAGQMAVMDPFWPQGNGFEKHLKDAFTYFGIDTDTYPVLCPVHADVRVRLVNRADRDSNIVWNQHTITEPCGDRRIYAPPSEILDCVRYMKRR